jgi:hypothetical protein
MTYEERLRDALRPSRSLYSRLYSSVVRTVEGTRKRLPRLLDRAAAGVSHGIGAAEATAVRLRQAVRARERSSFVIASDKAVGVALVAASVLLAWVSVNAVHAIATKLVTLVTDMINQALTQFGYPTI